MTGDQLAAAAVPADVLGVTAHERSLEDVDGLARLVGSAIGARDLPGGALTPLAEALAIMVLTPNGPGERASAILARAEAQWSGATGASLAAVASPTFGDSQTREALDVLREVGNAILAALGDRRVHDEAMMHLSLVMAAVAQGDVGLEPLP